jgi:uncharacterized repeat protein (TIGR01451 family)
MALLASSPAPAARGQDGKPPTQPPEAASPVPDGPPSPVPDEIVPPVAPMTRVDGEKPGAAAKKKPASPNAAGMSKNRRHDPAQDDKDTRPPYDPEVQKVQSAAGEQGQPPAAPVPLAPAEGSSAAAPPAADSRTSSGSASPTPALPMDRLMFGKQSVGVSVDVLGPSSMYLNQEATLKLIVRNTGKSDALNVTVTDELPEGLKFVSSQPEATPIGNDARLTWPIGLLPSGSDRLITLRVRPTKAGSFEHGATVKVLTGSKSRTRVLEPKLKVDLIATPTVGKVLKGQAVEFKVSVTNTGDGPARNVAIQAKLTPGLRHESAPRGDEQMMYEITIPVINQGRTETLDPLIADALIGGEQSCTVIARSPDVVFNKEEGQSTKTVIVVEPKLKLTLNGPESRYTDTIADYELVLENPGTAPARKVRIQATLPVNGRLVKNPKDAMAYDSATRRLQWMVDQIDPGSKPQSFTFQVRMGGTGTYELFAEATGEGGVKDKQLRHTEVVGMPDVDLVVSESKRVVDVGGQTTFVITLRNYGTKDASHLAVIATLSPNLKYVDAGTRAADVKIAGSPKGDSVSFDIPKLGAGKEMTLGVLVQVQSGTPQQARCKVGVTHDDLTEPFEDMASIRVTSSRRNPPANQ